MIGKITSVSVAGDKTLDVRWDDGASGLVDLAPIIEDHANLAALNSAAEFARVHLSADGWSVEWPSGIDFGAPQLRAWAKMREPVEAGA